MLKDKNPGFVWIGATDEEEEGEWKWTDCNTWNFTKWQTGEPNNLKDNDVYGENCAAIPSNKTQYNGWYDLPCHWNELHFVCTRSICPGEMLKLVGL